MPNNYIPYQYDATASDNLNYLEPDYPTFIQPDNFPLEYEYEIVGTNLKPKTLPPANANANGQYGITQLGYGNMNSQTTVVQNANRRFNNDNGIPAINLQNKNVQEGITQTGVGNSNKQESIGQLRRSNKPKSDKESSATEEKNKENEQKDDSQSGSSGLAQVLASMPVFNSLPSLSTGSVPILPQS